MKIVDLIESYGIELKRHGQLYIAFCPFHDDKNNPNLVVYPKTDSWYCFACQHGGDAIQFIALMEHIDRDEVKKKYVEESIKDKLHQCAPTSEDMKDFKKEILILTATVCRDFLRTHRDKLSDVMQVLKKLDEKMNTTGFLERKIGLQMFEKFKKYLYNMGGD